MTNTKRLVPLLFLLLSSSLAHAQWSPTGNLVTARFRFPGVTLLDGRALIAGGLVPGGTLASAELYDATTGTWSATQPMAQTRSRHTMTRLLDGKVLVIGGRLTNGGFATSTAELFDPATNSWSQTGSMNEAREQHAAVLLDDGRVLVTGGLGDGSHAGGNLALKTAEIYDPATGLFTYTDHMMGARKGHKTILLDDGRVLIGPGNSDAGDCSVTNITELWSPTTGLFSQLSNTATARAFYSAEKLPDGRVLMAGGQLQTPACFVPTTIVEIFDPATNVWSSAPSLPVPMANSGSTVLPGGRIFIEGGGVRDAMIFDPATSLWVYVGPMASVHGGPAMLLQNGHVLVAGGLDDSGPIGTSELFQF
jgi:hypothetical protein